MGCWNGTCGLTSLPIMHGTEMFVFPIVESYRDSFCYSTALYRPSALPFRAKYNDYGAGEECNGIGLDILMEGIKSQLVELEVGENEYHDIAVKREGFDVDMFFEACHEKRLRFQNPMRGYEGQPQTKDVFFTMVRKDVVDRLWNEWSFDLWKGSKGVVPEGFESDTYYIKNVTYAKLAELIPEYLEQCYERFFEGMKDLQLVSTDCEGDVLMKKLAINEKIRMFFEQPYNERDNVLADMFSHMFGDGYADGGFANVSDVKSEIISKYLSGDNEAAYALMRECLIGYMVNSFMGSTRKVWLPPMHQGSQGEELKEYKLLNNIVNDVIVEREKEFEWDEDE